MYRLRPLPPGLAGRVRCFVQLTGLHDGPVVPVPIWQVARQLGWAIWYRPLEGAHAALVSWCGYTALIVADGIGLDEQRLAIAHEIGHLIAGHPPATELARHPWFYWRAEREADLVALHLLCPPPVWQETQSLEEVAATCAVPLHLLRKSVVSTRQEVC